MIDLSWFTLPTGAILIIFGFMWFFLFFKSFFYKNILKKDLPTPKFSIITACRNEELVIKQFIDVIKKQTYKNWELLVCVNNTTDKTYERALEESQGYKCIKIFNHNPSEVGKGSALNYLIDKTEGDIILVFDTDNVIKSNYLLELSKYFMDSDINAVQTEIGAINGKKNIVTKMQDIEFMVFCKLFAKGRGKYGTGISGTGFAIRRELLKRMGGWRNELVEDLDLFLRLQKRGIKVKFAEDIMTYDEKPETWDTLINQRKRWIKGHLSIFFKNLDYFISNPFRLKYWLDFSYMASPISVVLMLSHLTLFYFMIFGGYNYLTYFYYPLSLWIGSLTLFSIILFYILWKEEKSYIKYIPFYMFVFSYHWVIVFFKCIFVKTWAHNKTIHKGIQR